jgi:hypothetical protein
MKMEFYAPFEDRDEVAASWREQDAVDQTRYKNRELQGGAKQGRADATE